MKHFTILQKKNAMQKDSIITPDSYSQVSNDVRVTIFPVYLENQSSPSASQFVWAYHVVIENMREEAFQLKTRYWRITDALGRVQEVSGDGVVGEEPIIEPGDFFEYTSGTPLNTPSGIMVGRYGMKKTNGETFHVDVPVFSLDSPHQAVSVH